MMRKVRKARLTPKQRKLARVLLSGGSVADAARRFSEATRQTVTWAMVNQWIERGAVSKRMLLSVQKVTRARLEDLM